MTLIVVMYNLKYFICINNVDVLAKHKQRTRVTPVIDKPRWNVVCVSLKAAA